MPRFEVAVTRTEILTSTVVVEAANAFVAKGVATHRAMVQPRTKWAPIGAKYAAKAKPLDQRETNASLVRAAKATKGLTIDDIADLLNVSRHTVAAWIRPDDNKGHNEPRRPDVERLYSMLGMHLPAP